ncbi:MAG: AI-2E family transporter [Bifidobacteriaceae bacterium]|jgi:predicted PurR-regulated permease PerM|nr:AI-2E family transporter [Bifidobacteriaceae bacterium]
MQTMQQAEVPQWLKVSGGAAWRFLALAAAVWVAVKAVHRVELVAVALFGAAVITSVLRPFTNLLHRVMPRALATISAFLVALAVVGGLGTFVAVSVSNQIPRLSAELINGIEQINRFLASMPAPISEMDLTKVGDTIQDWLRHNSGAVLSEVITRFGVLAEVMTGLILAIFCSVFFINSGTRMWEWFISQFRPNTGSKLQAAGEAAWSTFAGYTRGIVIVGSTNGLFAGLGLTILGIPLATAIGVLVAIGTFIPYVGSAIAMSVAVVVALAAKGPWWALGVVALIALIGQIEGHLLQPLIMSKQVSLHPVVVAITVVAGALTGGVIGAIVAVPVVAVIWSAFTRLRTFEGATELQPE